MPKPVGAIASRAGYLSHCSGVALLILMCANKAIAHDCFPSGLSPQLGEGSAWRTAITPAGSTKAWWCKLPARPGDAAGKECWRPQFFSVHRVADATNITSAAIATVGGNASISDWSGWLDDFRFVKGQAPYGRFFIPAALPDS